MKYSVSIEIDRPIAQVIAAFDNPENLSKWMQGLQSIEHISGIPGQLGAKSKIKFKTGSREIEMIETITNRNLPHESASTYEAKDVFNIVINKFEKITDNKTRHITEQEFQLKGMMKLIGWLMPAAFKKQSLKHLTDFINFVESN
ncbi:MAG: SRPBCC family protein [Bacteroidetes bacterium]|nr:SRPBCC family protein [Bacteroidota bacterium]